MGKHVLMSSYLPLQWKHKGDAVATIVYSSQVKSLQWQGELV